jgi:hypothetical protein
LGHCGIIAEKHAQVNRAFSADEFFLTYDPGALPQAGVITAPLALTDPNAADYINPDYGEPSWASSPRPTEETERMYLAPRAPAHFSLGQTPQEKVVFRKTSAESAN